MQHGGKVILQGLLDRAHLQRVRKLVAVDAVRTVKGGHLFAVGANPIDPSARVDNSSSMTSPVTE